MENEENNNLEKTNSNHNDSSININNIKNLNIENDKKEIIQNITPKITEIITQKNNMNDNPNENLSNHQITQEEYNNYKEKKMKLYNFYQTLLNFRQKLLIKEKHLNQREKNLLEFEKILKENEIILKNNIEQFESYMRNKITEIKIQFNQIEQLQLNKEKYLRYKEQEMKTESIYTNILSNNMNIKRCSNCNNAIFKEDELNKQYFNNDNYCKSCNNYLQNIFNQKSKTNNNIFNNNNYLQEDNFEQNNQLNNQNKSDGELFHKINYNCFCPICNCCKN